MKITVCELSENELYFIEDWSKLKTHLSETRPDLLLLPEMPFSRWIASEEQGTDRSRIESVEKHERWMLELEQLPVKRVVYSRPVITGSKFFNTAFLFDKEKGHQKIHSKSFFPQEPHFWEESWYDCEEPRTFELFETDSIRIGILLCTEMWFTEYARQYGRQGIDLLLCPRATGITSVPQWIRLGQTLSIISGAYCVSSNKSGPGANGFRWGGNGYITSPMDGTMLGITSPDKKFITLDIDICKSRQAKKEYPLYVKE